MQQTKKHISVIHFQRRSRPGFNYSIESFFQDLRYSLKDKVDFSVKISRHFNNGYFSKLYNIIEAFFRQKRNSISHITGEIHFLNLLMRKKNTLLTIHDCRFMERKKGLAKRIMCWLYLKAPIKKSAFIIAVSENTKKDIIKYTGCNAEKIKIIPVSINSVFKPAPKFFNCTYPAILHIGNAPNKNLSRLIDAVKEINCKLVIIGNPEKNELEKLRLNKIDFVIKSNLSTEELYQEYIDCDIVAFVSTFEGFGMPIVEANCVERAVLTSNISSMPEIAGDAACLVNPYNISEIRNGILRLINDKDYREKLIENGRENKLRFNIQTIADAYYQLYKNITADRLRNLYE